MGLFDIFLSEDKLIAKHARRMTDRDAQPEDREASVHFLAEKGTERSILGLLGRFDLALDHQMKDNTEKEYTFDVLRSLGDKAIAPTEKWLKVCKQTPWPLRLFGALTSDARALELAYELLQAEFDRDDFKPAKKKALLIWLADRRDARAIAAAAPFLKDFDEAVRYTASEVIIGQADDSGRQPLLDALVSPEEESNRLRLRIAEVFAKRRWSVAGADPEQLATLAGFKVHNDVLVAS
ncbi:MAG: hypothetical protein KC912_24140 [Proteobacteria bacterium]|nr:hypothetical protein [Pseudomonadota bacterium]